MPKLSHDGVSLAYDEAGQGDPPFVFIHGWSCNRTYFRRQAEHFSRKHHVISIDLRGHGESDAPEGSYDTEVMVADVMSVCQQLGVEKPVVVGHSLGAGIALHLAASHPEYPSAVVMVDGGYWGLNGEPPVLDDKRIKLAAALRGPDQELARRIGRPLLDSMFEPDDDPALREQIVEQMLSAVPHAKAGAMEGGRKLEIVPAYRACTVPLLFIQASGDRPGVERIRELCPQVVYARTVGAGHFNMLLVPEQVNPMIERFLTISGL